MTPIFDVIPHRKHITIFKLGRLWVFKHYFGDVEIFKALADYYNKDQRISLMKDLAAVEEALRLGAEVYEGINPF